MSRRFKALAGASAIVSLFLLGGVAEAAAAAIVGLVNGKTIVTIDPKTRKVTGKATVSGAGPLLGIDVRPADGMLYGLDADGNIVTIDIKSGKATMKSKLSEDWEKGVTTTFDFNPAADRLRLMSAKGVNLRINVDDGKAVRDGALKYKDGDANAGKTPRVVAGAYTNSAKGVKSTALYNIDAATGSLVSQAPPNDGVLNTIGSLGMKVNGPVAFNIVMTGEDNAAWLVVGGSLYTVDLKTGKATMAGKIAGLSGSLTDIAWVD